MPSLECRRIEKKCTLCQKRGMPLIKLRDATLKNRYFRKTVYTGLHSQLILMCLRPRETIDLQIHEVDQFIAVEGGRLDVFEGKRQEIRYSVGPGEAAFIPAGIWHLVVNPSPSRMASLYTLYAPAEHPAGTVERTKGA